MSYEQEFETVRIVQSSSAETRGVDAFALALIKAERQVRKLLTYLVYQSPSFGVADIPALRSTLGANRKVYFDGFILGFNTISPRSLEQIIGAEYQSLLLQINEAIKYRNKIFHGQLTNSKLSRTDLEGLISSISRWCELLADGAKREIGYDGFERGSFRKSATQNFHAHLSNLPNSVQDYASFIAQYMQRP